MNKSIYTVGLIVLSIIGLYMAFKITETIIYLFFSGMLLLLTYPLWSMIILGSLTALSFTYLYLTEK